jgi:hypothetical protein
MTARLLACTIVAPLVCGLGCQLPNPAFNNDQGEDGTAGTSGTNDTNDTNAEASTSVSTSGTTDDGDDDPLDTGMTAPDDGGKLDMMVESCMVPTHAGLQPRFGAPANFANEECNAPVGKLIKVVEEEGGDLLVKLCESCSNCSDPSVLVLSAHPLQLSSIIPVPPPDSDDWDGCYFVQTGQLASGSDEGCIYETLTIHGNEGIVDPVLFNANRDSKGLTPSAADKLGVNWHPELVDRNDVDQCACEELEIECCPNQLVVAKKFVFGNNISVYPGEDEITPIMGQDWNFYAAQAQSGVSCEPAVQTSWAIWPAG